jgi:hypothetical protein
MALGLYFGTGDAGDGDSLFTAFTTINNMFSTTTKLTSGDLTINDVRVGRGAGNLTNNTAIGLNALTANTSGVNNTVVGASALATNTIGNYNTAFGLSALSANTSGDSNTAIGNGSGFANQGGDYNTSLGSDSFFSNISGNDNTAIGKGALQNSTSNSNTAIGSDAGSTVTNQSNTTCVGFNAQANASNQVNLGNSSVNSLRCQVTSITGLSDARDKTNIIEIIEGLEFVNKLKPVTFTWNQRDGGRVGIKSAGFIAQDLLELQNDSLIGENLDLVSENDPDQLEARYANLLPVMIKAIQELTARINVLEGL